MSESQQNGGLKKSQSVVMDMKEMYSIATRQNAAWGIDGYEVPRQYLDSDKIRRDKQILEYVEKGKPIPGKKAENVKKKNFIDDELRLKNPKVGPNSYKLKDDWDMTKEEKEKMPKVKYGDRHTYIDHIFMEQKRRHVPGPGAYKVLPDDKDAKAQQEKLDGAQKITRKNIGGLPNYLNDFEYLGAQTPGPGFYNGRLKDSFAWDLEAKKLKTPYYTIQPKQWQTKHTAEFKKKNQKDNLQAVDPIHQDFNTFDKYTKEFKKVDSKAQKNLKFFGTENRFPDPKLTKSKSVVINPAPSAYNLMALWKGKEKPNEKEKFKPLDYHKLTKGVEKSIYY